MVPQKAALPPLRAARGTQEGWGPAPAYLQHLGPPTPNLLQACFFCFFVFLPGWEEEEQHGLAPLHSK